MIPKYTFHSLNGQTYTFLFRGPGSMLSYNKLNVVISPLGYWYPVNKSNEIVWEAFITNKQIPDDLKRYMDKMARLIIFS